MLDPKIENLLSILVTDFSKFSENINNLIKYSTTDKVVAKKKFIYFQNKLECDLNSIFCEFARIDGDESYPEIYVMETLINMVTQGDQYKYDLKRLSFDEFFRKNDDFNFYGQTPVNELSVISDVIEDEPFGLIEQQQYVDLIYRYAHLILFSAGDYDDIEREALEDLSKRFFIDVSEETIRLTLKNEKIDIKIDEVKDELIGPSFNFNIGDIFLQDGLKESEIFFGFEDFDIKISEFNSKYSNNFTYHFCREIFHNNDTDLYKQSNSIGVFLLIWLPLVYKDEGHIDLEKIQSFLIKYEAEINSYKKRTILTLDGNDEESIKMLFSELLIALFNQRDNKKSPVAVGKVLHFIAPDFFPIWDKKITEQLGCNINCDMIAEEYFKFCAFYKSLVEKLMTEKGLHDESGILKKIDEYYFIKLRSSEA